MEYQDLLEYVKSNQRGVVTQQMIADEFGCNRSNVSLVINGYHENFELLATAAKLINKRKKERKREVEKLLAVA